MPPPLPHDSTVVFNMGLVQTFSRQGTAEKAEAAIKADVR